MNSEPAVLDCLPGASDGIWVFCPPTSVSVVFQSTVELARGVQIVTVCRIENALLPLARMQDESEESESARLGKFA